jgi:Rrf2 family protein
MMISTRGRYALRVMIDLAEHRNGKYIPMKDVAARQEISLKYLERILPLLTQNGLLEGVHGGRRPIGCAARRRIPPWGRSCASWRETWPR